MNLDIDIQAAAANPQQLEQLYQTAKQEGLKEKFQSVLVTCYEATPDNLLYAAWFYRLQTTPEQTKPRRDVNWLTAVLLSIFTGLIFWALSDVENLTFYDDLPLLLIWWSPIATMSALVFLALTAKNNYGRSLALGLGLAAITAYAILLTPLLDSTWKSQQYVGLALIHIPLLCWIALGISILGFKSSAADRFAFLKKSIEVLIVAGLYLIFGMIFGGITVGMFAALSIELPEIWMRLIVAGGLGLLPVMAVATVYDPTVPPSAQNFDQGLSQFIATMMRLLLPLTLGVLVIYVFIIPFNFAEPFNNRDVLIVYNLMLFGILGLLLGATPIRGDDLSLTMQKWLRNGILAVAILAVLVSIYALSATVYRTIEGSLTMNRLTIIGWNTINIGILLWLVYTQFKNGRNQWLDSLQSVFSRATNAYMVWGVFLIIAVPLLFSII
mgnify:CR=1 FL=1